MAYCRMIASRTTLLLAILVHLCLDLTTADRGHAVQLSDARVVLREAKEAAFQIREPGRRYDILSTVAGLTADAGDLAGAKTIASHIPKSFEDQWANAMMQIASAYVDRKDFKSAEREIKSLAPRWRKDSALQSLTIAEAREGRILAAKRTLMNIRGHANWFLAAWEIMREQLQRGDVEGARATALQVRGARFGSNRRSMQEVTLEHLFVRMVGWQSWAGNVEGSLATVAYFLEQARGQGLGLDSSDWMIGVIAKERVRARDVDAADKLAVRISSGYLSESFQYEIADAQVEIGDISGAMARANRLPHEGYRTCLFKQIAWNRVKAGDYTTATLSVEEGVKGLPGVARDYERWGYVARFTALLAKMGEFDQARKVATLIPEPRRQEVLVSVAVYLARNGKVDEGLNLARSFSDEHARTLALSRIAIDLYVDYHTDRANTVIAFLSEEDRESVRARLVRDLVVRGQIEPALEVATELDVDELCEDVVMQALSLGHTDGMNQAALRIMDEDLRSQVLGAVAWAETQDLGQRSVWLAGLHVPLERAHALLGVAKGKLGLPFKHEPGRPMEDYMFCMDDGMWEDYS